MLDLDPTDALNKMLLEQLIATRYNGSADQLAAALGHTNGGFVREMTSGKKRVTDKTIRKIEALRGNAGWFSRGGAQQKADGSDRQKSPSFPPNETQGDTLNPQKSGTKSQFEQLTNDPPVEVELSWEQLMEMILKEGLGALERGVWVRILDDSMATEFNPGDKVRIQRFKDDVYKAGEFVLFRESGGDLLLREYRVVTSTVFEAVPLNSGYGTLHSKSHGLEPLARVTEVTKSYLRR